ncbi:hypothetical protein PTSG_10808 [Salpingoeca rosetta]|uniref:Receptor L-domain domain-containing protein n=1 Tax=Salpingoeca rosetta (strain ATCC 50818 / BSB-021) TaxID=946362 RepID=F2UPZ5_SALR5|nr:uncharacterized protein PTSG_10808 [Salpingoeca rosetta]EGD79825.1 hypothetical protein PTSG_10808 [Salpingoeca rosetta]|eukprot:XP_004988773.1 hypothetical protein PTSG_10808 [Salpingoeca rosetta]
MSGVVCLSAIVACGGVGVLVQGEAQQQQQQGQQQQGQSGKASIVSDEYKNLHITSLNNTFINTRQQSPIDGGNGTTTTTTNTSSSGSVFVNGQNLGRMFERFADLEAKVEQLQQELAHVRSLLPATNTSTTTAAAATTTQPPSTTTGGNFPSLDCTKANTIPDIVTEAQDVNHCCCEEVSDLEMVHGHLLMDTHADPGVELSELTSVLGKLEVEGVGLQTLLFASLHTVGGMVVLLQNVALTTFYAPALFHAGGVVISNNHQLSTVVTSKLSVVDGPLTISNNPTLSAVSVMSLASVTGDLTLRELAVSSLDFSTLSAVGGKMDISDNQYLSQLVLGDNVNGLSINIHGGIDIYGNPDLSQISFAAELNTLAPIVINHSGEETLQVSCTAPINAPGDCLILTGPIALDNNCPSQCS